MPLLLVFGTTRCGDIAALELVTMAVFYFPIKVHFEMRPWPAEPTHQSSPAEIPHAVALWRAHSKEAPGPIPRQKSNLVCFNSVVLCCNEFWASPF